MSDFDFAPPPLFDPNQHVGFDSLTHKQFEYGNQMFSEGDRYYSNNFTRNARGSFTPASIVGLSGWYDVSDSANRTINTGKVVGLTDKSGNGKNLSGSVGSAPALNSAGSQFSLESMTAGEMNYASAFVLTACTVVAAFRWVATTGFTAISFLRGATEWSSGTGHGVALFSAGAGNTGYPQITFTPGTAGTSVTNGAAIITGKHTVSESFDTSSNTGTFRVDGATVTPNPYGVTLTTGINTSKYVAQETVYVANAGATAEWCIYNRALTVSEIAQLESYLRAKWGTL